jgi:hypothetical protein
VRALPVVHVSVGIVLLWLFVWENDYSVLWVTVQTFNILAYLLKAKTVEPEKQPLLGNARTQQ